MSFQPRRGASPLLGRADPAPRLSHWSPRGSGGRVTCAPEAVRPRRRAAHLALPLTGHLPLRALRAGAPLHPAPSPSRPAPASAPLLPLHCQRGSEATSSRKVPPGPGGRHAPPGPPAPGLRVPTLPLDHRQVDPGHPQSQSRDAGRECTGTDPREKMPSLLSPSSCWQLLLLPQDGRSSKAYTFAPPFPPSSASPTLSFPIPWVKEPGPSEWLEK